MVASANSDSCRLIFGRFGRFIQFRLSSLCGAVVVAAVVFALVRLGLVSWKEASESVYPPLTGRYPLTASGDNSVQAARSQFDTLVCEAATGEKLFTLDLLGHPFDGHLYAFNPYAVPEGAPRWQRWNQRTSRWEPADQGLLLGLANIARGLVSLAIIALVSSCVLCFRFREWHWVRGVVVVCALTTIVCLGLLFVPVGWSARPIEAAALNQDGSLLATSSYFGDDSVVCVWDVATGCGRSRIDLSKVHADALAYSPDGTKLEVRNGGTVIHVWPISAKGAQ